MEFLKILKNQKQIFIQNLEKAYTEGIYSDTPANRKLGRVGMSYKKYNDTRKDIVALQDDIYDAIENLTKKRFKNDDYWNGVKSIKDKIGEVVEKYQDKYKDLQLYISVEDGGYRENNGSKWKEYKINIENGDNNSILEGVINCHAAGTVEDPFSEYDCSVIISPSNLDDDEVSKLRESIKKDKKKKNFNKISALWNINGKKLDDFISYINNLDEVKEDGIDGINVDASSTNEDKKAAIVKFYAQAAKKLLGSDSEKNINEVIKEALENFENNN